MEGRNVMRAIGIIAEYNPFHHGHRYQLTELHRMFPSSDGIIIAMSGSFSQRGTPCILDKWTRARHAVEGGADLVLELPFVFSCRSAQDFARGGVSLLAALGIVERLAFGTETHDIAPLKYIAASIDTPVVQGRLHSYINAGDSYAAALSRAAADKSIPEEMLRLPNNILAIEYLRALCQSTFEISPIAIPRSTASHNDTALYPGITSASSIRSALYESIPPWERLADSVPPSVYADLRTVYETKLPNENKLLSLLRYTLLTSSNSEREEILGVTEGIENRLIRTLQKVNDYDDLLTAAATKRYTRSRIARLILHLLIKFKKAQAARFDTHGATYIRPLAFNVRGQELLRAIKEHTHLPIITRTAKFLTSNNRSFSGRLSLLQEMLAFDTLATDLRLLTVLQHTNQTSDFITPPCVILSTPKG